ncbi:hypothetical protein [Pseudactinotalea terrae]|uniref:hypothetical protein n=1 Tax=Pseudactinotalea terrae TaxID=1743262 RepID=UPI0012E2F436|nr:hypothetical protein [Pseudactinotalea terrae]
MPFDPTQPFTRAQGEAAGLNWRHFSGPRYQRPLRGVYIEAGVVLTPAIRARAALLVVGENGAICGVSAADIRGLPVPVCEDTHVLVPRGAPRVRMRGIVTHQGTRKLSQHRGIPVTAMKDTFLDVAKDYPLVDAVVLGDAMVREGYVSPRQLVAAAAGARGRGAERARRAAGLVRARVTLPQESKLRLLLISSGFPEPETGVEVEAAGRRRELDTAYREWRVAVEYDGRHHVERDLQWSEDIERREELNGDQWKVVTVTGMQMWDPERVIARVRAALASVGAPLPAVSQEWRRHFPTRRRPS